MVVNNESAIKGHTEGHIGKNMVSHQVQSGSPYDPTETGTDLAIAKKPLASSEAPPIKAPSISA